METNFEKACRLIGNNFKENEIFFSGSTDESLINEAEKTLGLKFSKTYQAFLKKYGYGGVNSFDIDGVTEYKFDGTNYGGVVWSTINSRENNDYPHYLVPIYSVGEGTTYCLDTSQMNAEGECPVVAWPLGGYETTPVLEVVAPDFGTFFLNLVQREIEWKKEREQAS